MDIFVPVLVLTVVGLVSSLLLVVASHIFKGDSDERFNEIRACLPGINCSLCGYPNCDEYARGIIEGDVITKCRPGGKKTVERLAEKIKK